MKALLLVLSLFSASLYAQNVINPQVVKSSSQKTMIDEINKLADNDGEFSQGTVKLARVNFSVAADTGTIGAKSLGVYLPAKAVIIRSWFVVDTQFVDGGSGTVALSCEDANNIKTATDITGSAAGAIVEGASTGAASAFTTSIAARCQITATVAGADQTDGKLTAYVMYVVAD